MLSANPSLVPTKTELCARSFSMYQTLGRKIRLTVRYRPSFTNEKLTTNVSYKFRSADGGVFFFIFPCPTKSRSFTVREFHEI